MTPMKPMEPMQPMQGMAPMKPMEPMTPIEPWWPSELGSPNSSGSQNGMRYAYFGDARRLIVDTNGDVRTYDTGDYRIQGVGQQQGSQGSISFSTGSGTVDLATLKRVD